MTEKTLYYAKKLENGDILRISCDQHSVAVLVLGMSQTLLLMLIIAMVICAVIAKWTSKKIVEPLNKIDLETPDERDVYVELKQKFTKNYSLLHDALQKKISKKLKGKNCASNSVQT